MTTANSSSITHICPKCEKEKPLTLEFFSKKKRRTGYFWELHECLECRRDRDRARISSDYAKEKRRAATKQWKKSIREKDPDLWKSIKRKEAKRRSENNGTVYIPMEDRKQEAAIKNFINSGGFNARKNLKDFLDNSSDEEMACWYDALGKPWNNPRLTEAESYRIQYQLDPDFQIHERMRRQLKKAATNDGVSTLIWGALKRNGESPKVTEMLGYTIAELRIHIGRQFTKGMTWDKFMNGEIHIDHIHPKASFDLSDMDQWRICWSLPNLRPMWAKENHAKSAKILTLL